jgi:hypothetical protein
MLIYLKVYCNYASYPTVIVVWKRAILEGADDEHDLKPSTSLEEKDLSILYPDPNTLPDYLQTSHR